MAAGEDQLLGLLGQALATPPVVPAPADVAFQRRLVLQRRAIPTPSRLGRGVRAGVGIGLFTMVAGVGVAAASQGVLPVLGFEAPAPTSPPPPTTGRSTR